MALVTYIRHDGTRFEVDATPGLNLMEVALQNGVPGIDGDCGGNAACATCHVHVGADWLPKLGPVNDTEAAMLELADGADATSRLACQLIASEALAGLILQLPRSQH